MTSVLETSTSAPLSSLPPTSPLALQPQSKIQNPKSKIFASPFWLVLALTVLAGVLRFSFLDRPPIWGDEAMTFMRVCGTYQQLLGALREWGFTPLHYELYWWIKQRTELTPFMMRLAPAIAGILMVPAIYWLAVQIAGRRVALTAALLTATSGYLMNYSRDAKMYMPFWFFCTLNFACLLWWLRVRTRLAWWSWVASGAAMMGLHGIGAIVLGLELLIVLIMPRANWWSVAKFALLNIIGLAVLTTVLWRWTEWNLWWKILICLALIPWPTLLSPLSWTPFVSFSERGIPGRLAASMLRGFRWPPLVLFLLGAAIALSGAGAYYTHFNRYAERVDRFGLAGGGINWVTTYNVGRKPPDLLLFTGTAFLYNWEWPRERDQKEINPRTLRALKIAGIIVGGFLVIGLFSWPRAWRGGKRLIERTPATMPWTMALMLIATWIVVPAYACYCASEQRFVSPAETVGSLVLKNPHTRINWPTMYDIDLWPPFEGKFLEKWSPAWSKFAGQFRKDNLRLPENKWHWTGVVVTAAILIGSFIACGNTMRQRLFKSSILVIITLSLFVMAALVYAFYIKKHHGSVWMPRYLGFIWPAVIIAAATLLMRLPTRPLRWFAVAFLVAVNLAVFSARVFAGTEPPTPLMARDLLDSQPGDATTRMYWCVRYQRGGAPGTGYLFSMPGAYYLATMGNVATNPQEMLTGFFGTPGGWESRWKRWPTRINLPRIDPMIIADVTKTPRLQRVIVWDRLQHAAEARETLLPLLGETWTKTDERIYHVRDHWTWRELNTLRRRVYERVDS